MALIVQKYGGTSVGDIDRIRNVAQRIKARQDAGDSIVVVVSARSGVTNRLIKDAQQLHQQPDPRELDMLLAVGEQETIALTAIALHGLGVPAVSRTGPQAGILTSKVHTRARIIDIDGGDIPQQLEAGRVVIVAGFQGLNKDSSMDHGEITTLGRGGSDLTAIALAAALKAERCQICTDVDGVYTTDPRIVPKAHKIQEISYDEMLELASDGSKVMQARAVEFAKNHNVLFEVCSSFSTEPGTIVKKETPEMERIVVRGVAVDKNQVKVVVSNLPDQAGTAAKIFNALAEASVNVDMIVQNMGQEGHANLTFTVPINDSNLAKETIKGQLASMNGGEVRIADPVAKLSVVGVGMKSHSGVAAKLFTALADANINIQLISTSEIKISVIIDVESADDACRAVHAAFELERG